MDQLCSISAYCFDDVLKYHKNRAPYFVPNPGCRGGRGHRGGGHAADGGADEGPAGGPAGGLGHSDILDLRAPHVQLPALDGLVQVLERPPHVLPTQHEQE
eukprot:1156463-Prorocentrum_minimum.AAC.2